MNSRNLVVGVIFFVNSFFSVAFANQLPQLPSKAWQCSGKDYEFYTWRVGRIPGKVFSPIKWTAIFTRVGVQVISDGSPIDLMLPDPNTEGASDDGYYPFMARLKPNLPDLYFNQDSSNLQMVEILDRDKPDQIPVHCRRHRQ